VLLNLALLLLQGNFIVSNKLRSVHWTGSMIDCRNCRVKFKHELSKQNATHHLTVGKIFIIRARFVRFSYDAFFKDIMRSV